MSINFPTFTLYSLTGLGLAVSLYLFFYPKNVLETADEKHQENFVSMSREQIENHGIVIAEAKTGAVQTTLATPARLLLNQDQVMHLVPKVSGIVTECYKRVGDSVSEGETLAVFESGDMAIAKSKYLDAQKKGDLAATNLSREKQLYEKHISAAQDYQNAVAEADAARIELELARQHLHTMGLNVNEIERLPETNSALLRRYELRSPMNGIVIKKAITRGELIDTTREIYVVADQASLWAEIYLFPSDFSILQDEIEIELGKVSAQLISLSPSLDSTTGALRLVARLDNKSGEWRQGSYTDATLKGKIRNVSLAVPREAIQQIEGESVLFILKEKGFEVRPVKLGICDQNCFEVLAGLDPGEFYAIKNTFLLKAEHGKDEVEDD